MPVAGFVFGKQKKTMPPVIYTGLLVGAGAKREVRVYADNGFEVLFPTLFVKFNRPVEIAVIRKRERGHTRFFGGVHQLVYFGQSRE